ncbi:MAG: ATP-binding protein [bacterium]
MYIERNITSDILEALQSSPVILINGARQTGKSTLVQHLAKQHGFQYVTLDNYSVMDAVKQDPVGYLNAFKQPLIVDEVQRIPQIFQAIKQIVDEDRRPGRFLLTGSANVFMLPKLSESLAGRLEIHTLWPFSCDELHQKKAVFVDSAFSGQISVNSMKIISLGDLFENLVKGGYPEIQKQKSLRRRRAWFSAYITTILQREIQEISRIEGIHEIPRLLSLLASRSGSLLVLSSLSRDAGLVLMTMKRYLALLEATFLVTRLPAWFRNIGKRLIKAPKIYLNDTGLLSYLLGIDQIQVDLDRKILGQLLENFVMQELSKQITWSETQPQLYYFRTKAGKEIDFVMENRAGKIVAIEVKASATVNSRDFAALNELKQSLPPESFVSGIVLYTGSEIVPFGANLFAIPVNALWQL